jgi:hypothetical protein
MGADLTHVDEPIDVIEHLGVRCPLEVELESAEDAAALRSVRCLSCQALVKSAKGDSSRAHHFRCSRERALVRPWC